MGEELEKSLSTIGISSDSIIKEMFLGYKYRKREKKLYDSDKDIPINLIRLYYALKKSNTDFDTFQKAFVTHYIRQESRLEGLDPKSKHSKAEIDGFEKMYEYIHSGELDKVMYTKNLGFGSKRSMFASMPDSARYDSSSHRDACIASTSIELTLMELHGRLYTYTENPELGFYFRNDDRYLPGTGTEICQWSLIGPELKMLDFDFEKILAKAEFVKNHKNVNKILEYIDECVVLKCKLIKIHPFFDGNGRSIRALVNVLFEKAGLPPIYIKENEKTEYHKAMNKANNEGDYADIKHFYKYKICDSIVELDINNRLKQERAIDSMYSELTPNDKSSYTLAKRMIEDMKDLPLEEQEETEIDSEGVKIYKKTKGNKF